MSPLQVYGAKAQLQTEQHNRYESRVHFYSKLQAI